MIYFRSVDLVGQAEQCFRFVRFSNISSVALTSTQSVGMEPDRRFSLLVAMPTAGEFENMDVTVSQLRDVT